MNADELWAENFARLRWALSQLGERGALAAFVVASSQGPGPSEPIVMGLIPGLNDDDIARIFRRAAEAIEAGRVDHAH